MKSKARSIRLWFARMACACALVVSLAGCRSPYDYVESWLIREDPVRPFVIPSDVIYVQSDLYLNAARVHAMHDYAKRAVGYGRFSGLARVFSPLVASSEDVETALKWYFKYHHDGRRPFVFIGEGEGGALLRAYEKENGEDLRKDGLVASFYSEAAQDGFVDDEMVKKIREAVARARYRDVWERDPPEGMMKE